MVGAPQPSSRIDRVRPFTSYLKSHSQREPGNILLLSITLFQRSWPILDHLCWILCTRRQKTFDYSCSLTIAHTFFFACLKQLVMICALVSSWAIELMLRRYPAPLLQITFLFPQLMTALCMKR